MEHLPEAEAEDLSRQLCKHLGALQRIYSGASFKRMVLTSQSGQSRLILSTASREERISFCCQQLRPASRWRIGRLRWRKISSPGPIRSKMRMLNNERDPGFHSTKPLEGLPV